MKILVVVDMQKDFVVYHISSVTLDETMSNKPVLIDEIKTVSVNGTGLPSSSFLTATSAPMAAGVCKWCPQA